MNAITFLFMAGAIWFGLGWSLGGSAIKKARAELKAATHPILMIGLDLRIKRIQHDRKIYLARCIVCLIVGVISHLIVR